MLPNKTKIYDLLGCDPTDYSVPVNLLNSIPGKSQEARIWKTTGCFCYPINPNEGKPILESDDAFILIVKHKVYYWIGCSTNPQAVGYTIWAAERMADQIGETPVRQLQGREDNVLLAYFESVESEDEHFDAVDASEQVTQSWWEYLTFGLF